MTHLSQPSIFKGHTVDGRSHAPVDMVSISRDVQGFIHVGWVVWDFFTINMLVFREVKPQKNVQKTSKKAWPGRSNSPAISRDKGWIRTKECTWGIRTLEMEPKKHPRADLWVKTSKKLTARIVGSTLFLLKHSHLLGKMMVILWYTPHD